MTDVASASAPDAGRKTLGQAIRFALIGGFNTVLDFAVFSVLRAAGVPIVLSNLVSTSCGMVVSFFANRSFVFGSRDGTSGPGKADGRRQAILFVLGTAFSLYVLQSVVIVAITRYAPGVLDQVVQLAAWAGLTSETWAILVRSNSAKLIATAASLTFNFVFYRRVVFAQSAERSEGAPPVSR